MNQNIADEMLHGCIVHKVLSIFTHFVTKPLWWNIKVSFFLAMSWDYKSIIKIVQTTPAIRASGVIRKLCVRNRLKTGD